MAKGWRTGVFATREECYEQVMGSQGLSIRKNKTKEEAIAALTKGEFKMVDNIKLKNYVGYPAKDIIILLQVLVILMLVWKLM